MQIIREMSEQIEEELNDAEKYAKAALMYENYDKEIADMYSKMSEDEMKHTDMLHKSGAKLIEAYKAEGKTIPLAMQNIYDFLHQKHIDKAHEVKMYQTQYKE